MFKFGYLTIKSTLFPSHKQINCIQQSNVTFMFLNDLKISIFPSMHELFVSFFKSKITYWR
jgi:hypothetical protein